MGHPSENRPPTGAAAPGDVGRREQTNTKAFIALHPHRDLCVFVHATTTRESVMHIKQVVVEGFKTYREATTVDFQPHLNCIGALQPDSPIT